MTKKIGRPAGKTPPTRTYNVRIQKSLYDDIEMYAKKKDIVISRIIKKSIELGYPLYKKEFTA
jgi:hypothetical protein